MLFGSALREDFHSDSDIDVLVAFAPNTRVSLFDLVDIGLDIDPNENTTALKTYVENKGFDWLYAAPSIDVSRQIASLYGNRFLNPPSTPIVVIDRHGETHPLPFGIKSADDLMQDIQPFLDESM